jgi:hypothetical protein
MGEIERFPARQDVQASQTPTRLAFLLESLAVVILAALAAYGAS